MTFSNRTLKLMRAMVGRTLTDSCRIERETGTVGDYGQPLHVWEAVAVDVPCRLIRRGGAGINNEAGVAGGVETLREDYRLVVAEDVVLGVDYRVVVGGDVFEVVAVRDNLTDGGYVEAVLVRRRGL